MLHLGTNGQGTKKAAITTGADRERERRRVPRRAQPGALAVGRPGLHPADGRDERPRRQLVLRHGLVPEGVRADLRDRPRRERHREAQGARPCRRTAGRRSSRTRSRACASSGARSRTTSTTSRTGPATRTSTSAAPTSTRRRTGAPPWAKFGEIYRFVRAHRKPFAAPEWGLYGIDDPQFVQDMCTFLKTHTVESEEFYASQPGSIFDLANKPKSRAMYRSCITPLAAPLAVVGGRRRGLREGRARCRSARMPPARTSRSRSPPS